jgi:hypothetical protein
LLLAGGGVLLLGAGVVTGVIAQDTHRDYTRTHVVTESDASANADRLARGRAETHAANVLLGIGGAALVAGCIWWVIGLTQDHERPPPIAIAPSLGRSQLGLMLVRHSESL